MNRPIIETLIARQLNHYNHLRAVLARSPRRPAPLPGPMVTISRMAGCETENIATALAERLGIQVWGRELVDRIARDRGLRHKLVSGLERGEVTGADAWLRGVLSGRMFLKTDYVRALAETVGALAGSGGAVIVGRGAGFVLGEAADLRLRLVASFDRRVQTIMDRRGLQEHEARTVVLDLDAAREQFIRESFGRDVADAGNYDLVVDVQRVPGPVIVDACAAVVASRRPVARRAGA